MAQAIMTVPIISPASVRFPLGMLKPSNAKQGSPRKNATKPQPYLHFYGRVELPSSARRW